MLRTCVCSDVLFVVVADRSLAPFCSQEAGGLPFHLSGMSGGGAPEMSLYSSPSMPNISLGRPPVHTVGAARTATRRTAGTGLGGPAGWRRSVSRSDVRIEFRSVAECFFYMTGIF